MSPSMEIKITFTPEDDYNFQVAVELAGSNPHQTEVETLSFAKLMLTQHINLLRQGIRLSSRKALIIPKGTDKKDIVVNYRINKKLSPLKPRLKL